MKLYGDGRAALAGDAHTAERLGWGLRRRSRPDAAIVLRPRAGDPRCEAWIRPPGYRPVAGAAALWTTPRRSSSGWTYLSGFPGVDRALRALAAPPPRSGWKVGIAGLGRVGGTAATVLAALPVARTRIREILLHDVDAANEERWFLELQSIAEWRTSDGHPRIGRAAREDLYRTCDLILFAATAGVPPVGAPGDVRSVQFAPNRTLLATHLQAARAADYSGLFLVVSDPVESLALAAFHDGNFDARGRFVGHGLPPERIGGLALGVMWGRALAAARGAGWEEQVRRAGGAYGPHAAEVLVFDDLRRPDATRSRLLSRAARTGNLAIRGLGHLPYVGPAVSSVALALPGLLCGREVLASVHLDGIYFGAPARLEWGLRPVARRLAPGVRSELQDLHRVLRARAVDLGLGCGTPGGEPSRGLL